MGILEQSPCQTDKNIHIAGICYGRVGEVCRQQDPKRSSEQNKHRAFRKQEVAEGRPYFQNTIFSYNARYVKYREVKKPSFPDFGPFHGFWSRPGSGFSLQTDFAFLWLNCVFFSRWRVSSCAFPSEIFVLNSSFAVAISFLTQGFAGTGLRSRYFYRNDPSYG